MNFSSLYAMSKQQQMNGTLKPMLVKIFLLALPTVL